MSAKARSQPAARAVAAPAELSDWVKDARGRTLALVADLSDEQLIGPRLPTVNPMLWEVGHVAWFQEHWVLCRGAGRPPLLRYGDAMYDSAAVPHDVRWDLPLPSREKTLEYLETVRDLVLERLSAPRLSDRDLYFVRLSVFHEDMHDEAFLYTRQALRYPAPAFCGAGPAAVSSSPGRSLGDAEVPGGTFRLGAKESEPFVFDNEKWAHEVEVAPFSIARTLVTQEQFAQFVDDGGYRRRDLWTDKGWDWRESAGASRPVYWTKDGGRWARRDFDRVVPLEPTLPVIHVNAFEAEAYCRWARRRLPTEAEWEVAAASEPGAKGHGLSGEKRARPWGAAPVRPDHANLDARVRGCVDVLSHSSGDSAFSCRQMWGNAWQWTSTVFRPYPGFVADPYKEYSEPWFGTHRVLRGGAWPTRARLLRNTWRNFFTPDRRDIWAGFRTCATD